MASLEFIESFWKNKVTKVVLILLAICMLIFFIIVIYKAYTGQHVKILGIELNIPELKKSDTVTLTRHDTIMKDNIVALPLPDHSIQSKKTAPQVKQENQQGDNSNAGRDNYSSHDKNVNNGVNNGHIGDINSENQLDDMEQTKLITYLNQLQKDKPFKKDCVWVNTTPSTNGAKVASQIVDFLTLNGYKVVGSGTSYMAQPLNGINLGVRKDSCLEITVGVL